MTGDVYAETSDISNFGNKVKHLFENLFKKSETTPQSSSAEKTGDTSATSEDETPATTISGAISDQHLVAHRAKYNISFDKKKGDEDIVDANGWLTIQIVDTGNGWTFEQNSSLIIYNADGEGEQVNTNIASWQDYAGDNYRFNARTLRNGQEEDNIHGKAIRSDNSSPVKVFYYGPDGSQEFETTLPAKTVFPLHFLIHGLQRAKKGKNVVSDIVFDGSSETHEAVDVDAVIGTVKKVEIVDAKTKKKEILKQWSMNMAIYPLDSKVSEPEYEIKQNVLEAGIIKDMTLDYGSFTVKANLEEIQFFNSDSN